MADYYQLKNQNIFNPPANTSLGNATNQFNDVYVQNELVLGNTAVTGATINTPKVSTITYPGDDTAADPAGGQTITLTGSGFLVGATVLINNVEVSVVSVVNSTTITFTSPANSTGSYVLYVINTDGGTAIAIPGIQYSGTPTWTTAAGTLGSVYETQSFNSTVTATGDAPITYSVASGTLPPGATFNSNGTITGTSQLLSSPTTYTFTVSATDAELQDTNRTFSLTINPDVVTWNSPANGTSYSVSANSAISNVTLDATSAVGSGIAYSANALPDGISLSGNTISGTPTVAANSSSLLTATANTTSESANITINWVVSVSNDIYFEYNTLLIPGASTTFVDDASTNNFAVTINGDTKPNSFNPYTPGYYSNYLSGNTYLTAPANTALALGTGNFTIEAWIYATASFGTNPIFECRSSSSSAAGYAFLVGGGSNVLRVYSNSGWAGISTTTLQINTWYHVAVVRSGTGSNQTTFYVNGVAAGTFTFSANLTDGSSFVTSIGTSTSAGEYWNGYISNARIVKGTAVYTGNFTPSTTPLTAVSGTSLLTCQSNRFIDNSTNNFTLTVSGAVTVNSFQPFTPNTSYSTYGSGYFDGSSDYLTMPSSSGFTFGTGDFTVEGWAYVTAHNGAGANGIFQQGTSSFPVSTTNTVAFATVSSGQVWQIYAKNTNTFSSATWNFNTWYHFAVVRSSGTTNLYINGVAVITVTSDTTNYTGTYFGIGSIYGTGYSQLGYISDVRVVNGTAVYTTAFTPPTTPLTAIANTSLLTLQNNQSVNNNVFLDNSSNNFLITRTGNTTQGTFSPYGGNWSNYFGGQMVSTLSPSSTNFNLTGDFTLEAWAYPTSFPGGDWGILDARTSGASASAWLFGFNGAGKIQYYDGSSRLGATAVATNSWYHVAWVRNGSALRGYVNGVLDYYNGSYGTSAVSPGSTAPVIGTKDYGISSAWGTTGYISNLRVVNGTAVYTTSSTTVGTTIFTPSTTPLTPITNTVLLSCADSRFIDDSVNNYTITPSSSTISAQRFSPFNPSSVTPTSYSGYFDGTGDYLTVTYPINWSSYGSYTAEFWFYTSTIAATNFTFLSTGSTNYTNFYMYGSSGAYPGAIAIGIAGVNEIRSANSVIAANSWYHIAYTYNGTTTKIYVNGVEVASSTTNVYSNNSANLTIANGLSNNYMLGYMSNLRIVQGTVVYTSAFTPPTTPLTAISGTSLLTCQSSTFIDNSTNNFTITAFGNSQPRIQNPFGYTSTTTSGYTPSTIGGSGYFDGSGDYLSIADNPAFQITGDFTFEAWVYQTSSKAVTVLGQWPSASTTSFIFRIDSNGKLSFAYNVGGEANGTASTSAITYNTWNHVVWTRSGTTVKYFINGVQDATTVSVSGSFADSAGAVLVGLYNTSVDTYFNGYISDARFIKGTSLYTGNFVPSAQPLTAIQNTVLLTNMTSAGIYDASMMNDMETVGDANLSTAVSKFGGSSMYFDGTGDYLKFPSNQIYAFGTGDFTIEGWLYFTGNQNFGPMFISSTTGAGNSLHIQINNANKVRVTNETTQFLLATNAISLSTWTHIAVVRSGTTLAIYQNGTLNGTITNSTDFIQNGALVGLEPTGGSFYYAGYIDDLRITKGYARYTSNFTPPTSAFPLY